MWRSPVAHLLWEQGVGGSNPLTPTNEPKDVRSTESKGWSGASDGPAETVPPHRILTRASDGLGLRHFRTK